MKIWERGGKEEEGGRSKDSHDNFHSKTTLLLITGEKKKKSFLKLLLSLLLQPQRIVHHAFTFWIPEGTLAILQHTINLPLTETCDWQKKDGEITHPEGSPRNSRV